jgi:hypothetical protein
MLETPLSLEKIDAALRAIWIPRLIGSWIERSLGYESGAQVGLLIIKKTNSEISRETVSFIFFARRPHKSIKQGVFT